MAVGEDTGEASAERAGQGEAREAPIVISGDPILDAQLRELERGPAALLLMSEAGEVHWASRRIGALGRDDAVGLEIEELLRFAFEAGDVAPSPASSVRQDDGSADTSKSFKRQPSPSLRTAIATVVTTGVPVRYRFRQPVAAPGAHPRLELEVVITAAPRTWPGGFRLWVMLPDPEHWERLRLDGTAPQRAGVTREGDQRGSSQPHSVVDSAQLRLALKASGVGLWSYDLRDDLLTLDDSVLDTLGFRAEGGARRWSALHGVVHVEDRALVDAALETSRGSGLYGPIEYRVIRPDGDEAWVYSQARMHVDGDGHPRTLVGGVLDITDRRRLQVQLAEAQKLESVARLAGGVAHDFNNMLTVILSYADSLMRELEAGGPQRAQVHEIRQAARRSAALTAQLLAFARRQISEPQVVDPNSLLEGIRRLLRRVLGEDVELIFELDEVPCIEIDPTMLEQAIVNLALNAKAAMPEGGRLTILTRKVSAANTSDPIGGERFRVSISLEDTGLGIPLEEQAHVFEPFYTTRGREGTGLGLAMVHGVVTQAGGSISLVSAPQQGTRIELSLPASKLRPHMAAAVVPEASQPRDATILVVEDENAVRAAVCTALRDAGFDVLECSGAPDAIGLLKRDAGKIACVVSDVVMPQINGLQLAAILRSIRPGLPVLLVSAYTETRIAGGAGLGENMEFLAKPFVPAVLVRRVEQLLARAESMPNA